MIILDDFRNSDEKKEFNLVFRETIRWMTKFDLYITVILCSVLRYFSFLKVDMKR